MFTSRGVTVNALFRHVAYVQRRYRHKQKHWVQMKLKKKTATDLALKHFDDLYQKVYGKHWPSIRVALLSPHKYCAVVNNFSDGEKIIAELECQGAMNLKRLFDVEKERLKCEEEEEVESNENLDKIDEETLKKQVEREEKLERMMSDRKDGLPPKPPSVTSMIEALHDKEPLSASLEKAEIDTSRMIDPGSNYSSLVSEFVPATKLQGTEDWVFESDHYNLYKDKSDFPITVKKEFDLHFPHYLNIYTFERGNVTPFPKPEKLKGIFNYYLLNGSSVMPVLALDLKYGDQVFDMCAGPGGKSLMMIQTMFPKLVQSNEISKQRAERLQQVFNDYLQNVEDWQDGIKFNIGDGRHVMIPDTFNKILVDAPCTTDRLSVVRDDNNLFKTSRVTERLEIPHVQSQLLTNALKMVVPGGTVVYSTCSLSPIQNDGVVYMALRNIWEETNINIEVRDMSPALRVARNIFKFADSSLLKFGHLILPFLPCNFGPLYFCKLVRTK